MRLSDLSEDERAVYLAAFGAYVGSLPPVDGIPDRYQAAQSRGMRAVRWFRLAQREELERELRKAGHQLEPGF